MLESVRVGPEPLVDVLGDGRRRAARHRVEDTQGADSIPSLTENIYIGQDNPTPEFRTGLYTLRNVEDVSLIACPGRTTTQMQNALISHCEGQRFRFAVLDSPSPPGDTLAMVQNQRQQFDTKYAALYYPWLLISDPYPTNLALVPEFPIPPSGHCLGIIARTDIERGVHKAASQRSGSGNNRFTTNP